MELWTEEHAPSSLDELPQEDSRRLMRQVGEERLNALLHGPSGSGKSAAAKALAHDTTGEGILSVINASDFFGLTKKELQEDPRFTRFISKKRARESSKADLVNHVLKETASHPSVGGGYRLLLIDNAEKMRRDFQQALRRVMERHSGSCQFILTTRSLSAIIPAIRSRCFQIPFPRPTKEGVTVCLERIVEREQLDVGRDTLEYLAEAVDGDLRRAVLVLQAAVVRGDVSMDGVYGVIQDAEADRVPEMLELAMEGDFRDAVDVLDDLLIDQGYTGSEVLMRIVEESGEFGDENAARLVARAGEVEEGLVEGANDRIHLERFLSGISR